MSVDLRRNVADVVADARSLPFPDGSVEEILASDVLEHFNLSESFGLVAEWRRVLRPGGVLTVRVPNLQELSRIILEENSDQAIVNIYGGHRWGPAGAWDAHHTGWTPASLEKLLLHAGFSVESNDLAPNMTVTARVAPNEVRVRRLGLPRSVTVIVQPGGDLLGLLRCLVALSTHPPCEDFQTVLVDDGTDVAVSSLLAGLEGDVVIVESGAARGPAQQANLAASFASGEVLFFLDAAVEVTADWARPLLRRLETEPDVGIVIPAVGDPRMKGGWSLGGYVTTSPTDEMLMVAPVDGELWTGGQASQYLVVPTEVMAVRRACLRSVGGFDDGFFSAMDRPALAAAARQLGWWTACEPGVGMRIHAGSVHEPDLRASYIDRARFTERWGQFLESCEGYLGGPTLRSEYGDVAAAVQLMPAAG
ncbi:MAG TPA: glycosyltransferase [Acidimicrobiales bacterium]|nr:glycosyltransferase [Acidimicrobiales bacterium]